MNIQNSSERTGQSRHIDLSHLPVTQVDKGSKGLAIFLMGFAGVWGGIPTAALGKAIAAGKMQPSQLPLLLFTVIGTGIFMGGLYLLTRRITTTIARDQVSVLKRSLFGESQWSAPLSAFTGVRNRSEYHTGGKNQASYTLYLVELLHPESRKTVRLYESRSDAGVRGIWEDACRALNMPAVEGEGAQAVKRAVEDLDKSVKELAREGKLHVEFDAARRPPEGVTLKVDGKFLEVSVPTRKGAGIGGTLVGLMVSGVFVYIGFFLKSGPVFFGIIGALFMLLMLATTVWSWITTEQVRVAKDEIHLRRQTPWGPTKGTSIAAASVEVVRIGKKDNQGYEGILIETNAGTTQVATGLSAATLDWLKNCLLKVISEQDWPQATGPVGGPE